MSAKQTKPKDNAAPVVVLRASASDVRRQLLRMLPASCISVLAHGVLLFLFFLLSPSTHADHPGDEGGMDNTLSADSPDDKNPLAFAIFDINLASRERDQDISYPGERLDDVSIPGAMNPNEIVGINGGDKSKLPVTIPPPGGFGPNGTGGALDAPGRGNSSAIGDPGSSSEFGMPLLPGSPFGRSGATRMNSLRTGGGTDASEAAVARGLKWIARQQLPDGRWMLNSPNLPDKDRGTEINDVAATALGLLPLLAAGRTHKPAKDNAYDKVVDKGLKFLMRSQNPKTGYFGVSMYAHGLATIAMCEAYGMTQDPALRRSAQNALNLIVQTQHEAGGWRYGPSREPGDLSVSGWQIMALKSGQMAGLDVPQVTIRKAVAFLDACANSDEGYGYLPANEPKNSMTAVALLCRQYIQNWGPAHPRMIKSIDKHVKTNPPDRQDVYYYYYATQVMHHFGGDAWRAWNEKMREQLIAKQETNQASMNHGSWSPAGDPWGRAGGRLMMTSLNLLTLEVYYRYLPLYYRDAGYKMDETVKKSL
jgi:hypothetical protein